MLKARHFLFSFGLFLTINAEVFAGWRVFFVNPVIAPSSYGHAMTYNTQTHSSVLWGGIDYAWSGVSYSWAGGPNWQRNLNIGPNPRWFHSLAHDERAGSDVLFGGVVSGNNGALNFDDLWELTPEGWIQNTITGSRPAARFGHSMVYDSDRGKFLMFGGGVGTVTDFGDTWEWDNQRKQWQLLDNYNAARPTGPCPRRYHSMVYDSARKQVILFGGLNSAATPWGHGLSDMWAWNSAARKWQNISTANGPAGRYGQMMAYDSNRHVTMMFGGTNYGALQFNDTWIWNGQRWNQITQSGWIPVRRNFGALSFDKARDVFVLFGGFDATVGDIGDTWEFSWPPIN